MKVFSTLLLLSVSTTHALSLFRRQNSTGTPQSTCSGLNAQSNNGDRKIAIVIDSSGSMSDNDPTNLRIAAGKALNDWLITQNEAVNGKKKDLVTVIDFDDYSTVDFALGDPAAAVNAFDLIDASGGTYIAGGVNEAISQLTASSSGATKDRSAIVVLTDGEVDI
jgi:hypothetical protein